MSIEIKNLDFTYKKPLIKTIFKGISFEIADGEVVSLLGPSGCGKTTLIKLISSYLCPDKGDILIDNIRIEYKKPYSKLAYVSQVAEKMVLPWKSVYANILYPLKSRRLDNKKNLEYCSDLMKKLKIWDDEIKCSFPYRLSGGQNKRVTIAMALSYRPKLILFDEPFSGIDFILANELWAFLFEYFHVENATAIFVTHNWDEAIIFSDKVIFINEKGELHIPLNSAKDFGIAHGKSIEISFLSSEQATNYRRYLYGEYLKFIK